MSTGECVTLAHTTSFSHDGTERQIADSAAPIRDDAGTITGVVLVFSDVTEQYRARDSCARVKTFRSSSKTPVTLL